MLSQNKTKIMITTLVISATTLGGVFSAKQIASAKQVVNDQQQAINAQQVIIRDEQDPFNNKQYKFPPPNALQQFQQRPVRPAPGYPGSYPAQRQVNPNARPNYSAPGYAQRPMPMRAGPGAPPYGMPNQYNRNPYYQNPYNHGSNNHGSNNHGPYGQRSYGNPYNRGSYGSGGPFDKFGMGPFNGDTAPWETWPFGAPDSIWSRKELPFKDQNPTDWFQPDDPKEGMAIMWDDLISAPDDLGTMPGGWRVPSVSVPNPVDLEDQLERASKEVPDLIRVYSD